MSKKTVVLNFSYDPLREITWQKAVTLIFLNKAEVISNHDKFIASPSIKMQIPAIIRLTSQVKWKWTSTRFSRQNVFRRDKFRCQYCGTKHTASELTFDHVVPKSIGGKTGWYNIVSACKACNQKKGDRTPQQANMTLLSDPKPPKISLHQFSEFIEDTPETE
jgi:5-methylcytosine-specific restriction endonuclease McrA